MSRPCPFCGRKGKNGPKCSISGKWHCDSCCEYEYDGMNISWETAQKAYCWTEIDKLQKIIKKLKKGGVS